MQLPHGPGPAGFFQLSALLLSFAARTLPASCLLQSILQRRGTAISYWGSVVIQSVETGFSGCLTTVSTFVTEASLAQQLLACLFACQRSEHLQSAPFELHCHVCRFVLSSRLLAQVMPATAGREIC
jgi:hypothetical protein